jgi:hypothetical protein
LLSILPRLALRLVLRLFLGTGLCSMKRFNTESNLSASTTRGGLSLFLFDIKRTFRVCNYNRFVCVIQPTGRQIIRLCMNRFYFFRCHNCPASIPLLNTKLSASGDPLRKLPSYVKSIAVLCPHCNQGGRYQRAEIDDWRLDLDSASNQDKETTKVWSTTTRCATVGCGEIYRVLTVTAKSSSGSDEVSAIRAAGSSILCPGDHPLTEDCQLGPTDSWIAD